MHIFNERFLGYQAHPPYGPGESSLSFGDIASDLSAIGAMLALRDHHISIPDNSVADMDNIPFLVFANPALTTVQQNTKYSSMKILVHSMIS